VALVVARAAGQGIASEGGRTALRSLALRPPPFTPKPERFRISSSGRFGQAPNAEDRVRINHQIRLSPVRLIDPEGGLIGVVPVEEARQRAEEMGLDLVEVNPNVRPIVCRIMDYGRFKYDKQKKERKSKSAAQELKQIKYRPGIDGHDFETKTNHLRTFLEGGYKVRVTVMFRRRDMRRPENGIRVLQRVAESLSDVGRVEDMPNEVIGRDLTCTISPLRQPIAKKEGEAGEGSEQQQQQHRLRRHERVALEKAELDSQAEARDKLERLAQAAAAMSVDGDDEDDEDDDEEDLVDDSDVPDEPPAR
jgi:translation initiation factor IF-3